MTNDASVQNPQFSIGLCHEFEITARKAGWEPKDLAALAHNEEACRKVLTFVRGQGVIETKEHLIDLRADPFVPEGWKVEEHIIEDSWKFNAEEIDLFLADGQKDGKYMIGNELRKVLTKKPVWNANVLDYLLAHTELIPESWKGKAIFFWGTVYRNSGGRLCVRYLHWRGGRWDWYSHWLDNEWYDNNPAAVRKAS
jgi:hypothetical protein